MLPTDTTIGKVIPIIGVTYNPTHDWLAAVYRFHDPQQHRFHEMPHYGGARVAAVLMVGGELENPDTNAAIQYNNINWPGQTTVLSVFELDDGSLWEELTDTPPVGLDPGQPIVRGQKWQTDWLLASKARTCDQLIGKNVTWLYLLGEMSERGLKLHKSRLAKQKRIKR